eukprot:6177894-Pleurochrysis_carterae.AAC.1
MHARSQGRNLPVFSKRFLGSQVPPHQTPNEVQRKINSPDARKEYLNLLYTLYALLIRGAQEKNLLHYKATKFVV